MKLHTKNLIQLLKTFADGPETGVEVGVWKGDNAANLLRKFGGLRMILVDRYLDIPGSMDYGKTAQDFNNAWMAAQAVMRPFASRSRFLLMESKDAANFVPNNSQDFVFLDASHYYDAVRRDIEIWFERVRTGGFLCGHDYGGVGDRMGRFGVKRAVDEFAARTGREVGTSPGLIWWVTK